MSLSSLLGEWAGLEPERCRVATKHGAFAYRFGGEEWDVFAPEIDAEDAALVQVAVQEAIEARGWYLRLEGFRIHDNAVSYVAIIYGEVRGRSRRLGQAPKLISTARHEEPMPPAEALLTAYLEALKAAKEDG